MLGLEYKTTFFSLVTEIQAQSDTDYEALQSLEA